MDRVAADNAGTSAETFALAVQEDASFETLFAGADSRQRRLVDVGCDAAQQAIEGDYRTRVVRPHASGLIAHALRSPTERMLVIDPGRKGRARAREKLRTRYRGKPAGALADIARIMVIPSAPRLCDAIAAVLKLRFRHFDTGWRVRPSGHFSRALYIEVEQRFVGEIAFQNAGQYRSGNRSHPLYEIVRRITGPDHRPDPSHAPVPSTRSAIAARCNSALTSAGLDGLATFRPADFGPERYWPTYYSLLRIVQEIHECAISRASYAWREIYGDCVSRFNSGKYYADRLRVA